MENLQDGIHGMLPFDKMIPAARKYRNIYNHQPGAAIPQGEFGFYCLDKWKEQGMPQDVPMTELFGFEDFGTFNLGELGWCEAGFNPSFEEKIIEDRGDYEVVQDFAGRHVLFFKGRRNGFMPEYLDHPVKDMETWVESCKWRMDPFSPERYKNLEERMNSAKESASEGRFITQQIVGGYMYLRSLIGPESLLYMFYDNPELIHECMKTWFELADTVISKHQEYVTLDEVFIGEDICYNHGPLISPDMIREFLFPYYKKLLTNIKARQIDKQRHLYFQVDTDGYCLPVIDLYCELGMDVMSPFEVASGCDVVEIAKQYPHLIMRGGIDKRVLASSREDIDNMINRILPTMKARGGYIPMCDHGVPEEVSYDNYLYFRKRCLEFSK